MANRSFHYNGDVHVVKDNEAFSSFSHRLDVFMLTHRLTYAFHYPASEGEPPTSPCFELTHMLASLSYINFE